MKVRINNIKLNPARIEKTAPLFNNLRLRYTKHALDEARSDRYGNVAASLPTMTDLRTFEVVETEENDGVPVKAVMRNAVTVSLDLVLVVLRDGTVKTVWINEAKDNHKTLNKERLAR